jgi:hypothetical protein
VTHPDDLLGKLPHKERIRSRKLVGGLSRAIREASDAGVPPAAGEGSEAKAFAAIAAKLLEAVAH